MRRTMSLVMVVVMGATMANSAGTALADGDTGCWLDRYGQMYCEEF